LSAFGQVLGQVFVSKVMQAALEAGRSAQAYLFFGPGGCGKKTAAMALAQALFCRQEPNKGCGSCTDCRRVREGKHPDFFVFGPQGSSFKVEQVRDILREAAMKPYEASRRVMVLDKVELMSPEAANALLKVLEEPNASLCFVLVTTSRAKILPTIASRCQAMRFGPLPEPVLAGLIERDMGLSAPEAKALAGLSGGSLRTAQRLSGEQGAEIRELAEGFLEAAASHSTLMALNWSASAVAEKKRLDELFDLIGAYLRELWIDKAGLPKHLKILAQPPKHGGGLSPERVQSLMLAVSRAQGQAKRNANLPLLLDHLAVAGA
jgi:DNA polymerase-3 subunit delta'